MAGCLANPSDNWDQSHFGEHIAVGREERKQQTDHELGLGGGPAKNRICNSQLPVLKLVHNMKHKNLVTRPK